jgi:hypothetical protein
MAGKERKRRSHVDGDDEESGQDDEESGQDSDSEHEKKFACTHAGVCALTAECHRSILSVAGCNKTYKGNKWLNRHILDKHGTVAQPDM